MEHPLTCLVVVVVALASIASSRGGELSVLPARVEGGSPRDMTKRYLLRQVDAAWTRWRSTYEQLKTPEQVAAYQERLRDRFVEALGGFPERTPLSPQVTGVVQRDGYRVEKILFESRPKFYVSAAFFVPDASRYPPPYPGVLVPCGHAQPAKAHDEYQSVGALLALNGMAALVYDPVEQGEYGRHLIGQLCDMKIQIFLSICRVTFFPGIKIDGPFQVFYTEADNGLCMCL